MWYLRVLDGSASLWSPLDAAALWWVVIGWEREGREVRN
jgi:hypothetical protein